MINQWFYDGNKRTANIIANKILINNGHGMLIIKDSDIKEFEELLENCHEKPNYLNKNKLFDFLLYKCLMDFY